MISLTEGGVVHWRRLDVFGLERLTIDAEEMAARSSLICLEDGGFKLDYIWRFDADQRSARLQAVRSDNHGQRGIVVARHGDGWTVDDAPRPDLADCSEIDLSVTPFCNTFPIQRLGIAPAFELTLDVIYIDAADMSASKSRQSYVREAPDHVRYIDRGRYAGFEADIRIDSASLVSRYGNLFERVA